MEENHGFGEEAFLLPPFFVAMNPPGAQ
jgi:hypothetical protein